MWFEIKNKLKSDLKNYMRSIFFDIRLLMFIFLRFLSGLEAWNSD